MTWASYSLAALAVVLAWPAPVLLSGAQWPARSPFTAMILWQAIALAGGLSMIGAMLVWGLAPLGSNLLSALAGLAEILFDNGSADSLGVWHIFALSAALLLSMHLVFILLLTYVRTGRQRRRHRDLLHMLSSPAPDSPDTVVISHPAPVAYCLPGGARSVTVLSDGLVDLLRPAELEAVLIHEQTHLTQRHHLLLWAFAAWRSALPWLPTSQLAQRAVTELIEMLADDEALKEVDPPTLIGAIAIVASGDPAQLGRDSAGREPEAPAKSHGAVSEAETDVVTTARRVGRLLDPQPALPRAAQGAVVTAAGLLLAVPTVLLLVPELWPY